MHKSKLSQNFYTIGRNNELKEISSSFNDRIYFKETGSGNTFSIKGLMEQTEILIYFPSDAIMTEIKLL